MEVAFSLGAAAPLKEGTGNPHPKLEAAVLDWVAASGFAAVELVELWRPFLELAGAELAELREAVESRGLRILSLNCFRRTLPGPDERLLREVPRVAAALGARVASVAPFPPPGCSAEQAWAGAAAALARVVSAHGDLEWSLELHDEGAITATAADCLRLAEAAGTGVNPDLGNWLRARGPQEAQAWRGELLALAPRANVWHVKNYRLLPQGGALPAALPDGDIDYRWSVAVMRRSGFEGPVVVEPPRVGDALAAAARGRAYLEELLAGPPLGGAPARRARSVGPGRRR